jgi:hypothetical protein
MNRDEDLQTPAYGFNIKFEKYIYHSERQNLYEKYMARAVSELDTQLHGHLDYEIIIMCSKYFDPDSNLDAVIEPMLRPNMKS